ncbi:MAG: hypothetical protein ACI305_03465 [Lepagella sp.]
MRLRLFSDIEARLSRVRLVDKEFIYCPPESATIAKLPGSPAINHVGLWNENTTRLTQLRPLAPPAVFIEFYPVTWGELGRNAVHGDMVIRLHIVTATLAQTDTPYREEALHRFRLIRAVKAAFVDFGGAADDRGRSYSRFRYSGSSTDHNHEQVCEDLEEWQTHCVDCSATIDNGYILTPRNVTLDLGDIFADAFGEEMV